MIASAIDTVSFTWLGRRHGAEGSPNLGELIATEVNTLIPPSRRPHSGIDWFRPEPWRPFVNVHFRPGHRYGPEHVPQLLPTEWREQYLNDLADAELKPFQINRAMAIRLIQQVQADMNIAKASAYLGISRAQGAMASYAVTGPTRQPASREQFEQALDEISSRLEDAPDPIDYAKRRACLATWTIPDDQWDDISSQRRIPRFAHVVGDDHRLADQITQHAISILIWARATSSEPLLTPLLARYRSTGETHYASQLTKSVRKLKNTAKQRADSGHDELTTVLDDFADKLAQSIDEGRWPAAN